MMGTFIYRLFKKDKANVTLLALICLLLCIILYKEIEFKRWQRCHYGVSVLQTPGVANYMYFLSVWSSKDCYYPNGVGIGNQKIDGNDFDCEISEKLLLPPDKLCVKWTSVADRKLSWIGSIDLDKNVLRQYKGNWFAVQLQKDGKVTLYVTNATTGMGDVGKGDELKEAGIYQATLVEPEKMIANVAKELLRVSELNITKKKRNDSICHMLNKAFDIYLSGSLATNDSLKACISTLLGEEDAKCFEEPQEVCRIKKRRANCLLALALLSDEKERDELIDSAHQRGGRANWETEDKELTDTHAGIRFVRLLFQLQQNSFNVTPDLLRIGRYLHDNEEYMTEQQFKHGDELVQFLLEYYFLN